MTELQKRMIRDIQLAGLSARTQECYVRSVKQLAEFCKKPPDKISAEEIRDYFLYVKNDKKWARATCTIAICGIKFFWEKTLKRDWLTMGLVRPAREKRLPVILSREEVITIMQNVRFFRYRACLETIYSMGLRVGEGTRLKICDMDSARMVVHVRNGKGGKARFLQHVLPKGFCKVRYYGFLHQRCREKLKSIKKQLKLPEIAVSIPEKKKHCCPHCGEELVFRGTIQPQRGPP